MNQRHALVLYEASDGSYAAHRSTYIGRNLQLAARISSETPYGHGDGDYEPALVEETPLEEGVSLQRMVDRLDFSRFGAVVRVSDRFEVRPYRAIWFGLSEWSETVYESDAFGNGAIIGVSHVDGEAVGDGTVCTSIEAAKAMLGGLVDAGDLAPETARSRLRGLVAGYAASGHDVVFASGLDPRENEVPVAGQVISSGRRLLELR
ncbi:DUF6735 family protein [Natronomonas amylolytica]|uniref:DUF6735 family protein n=1 Tax=Natronomonas amylolytica TaxID=3108498 RepID=UPI00300B362C